MGMIEEGRQLFQDFVAPEIRAIEARLDTLEKQVASLDAKTDKRADQLESKIDRTQAQLESKIDRNQVHIEAKIDRTQAQLESKIDRNQAQVLDTLNRMETYAHVLERLARLEGKVQNVA
jgi:tetrahydromethanopterin S-methyltransferase subunit G